MSLSVEPVDTCSDVRIATLHVDDVEPAMYGLLRLLFFDRTDERRFVSVTCTQRMITLVADQARLALVPGLEVDSTEWAVLRVDGVLDVVGAIASLTSPLAAAGIPVFHLSTYDSELVLVPRAHLEEALHCFSGGAAAAADDEERPPSPEGGGRRSFALKILAEHRMTILRLEKQFEPWHLHALLRLLFFPEPDDPEPSVVNLTWSPDNELSILAGVSPWWMEHCQTSPEGLSGIHQEEMVPISLVAPLNATGVVAAMATVLAGCQISILGCSTLLGGGLATDFTLVPLSKLAEATLAFEAAGFSVSKNLEEGGVESTQLNGESQSSGQEDDNSPLRGEPDLSSPALRSELEDNSPSRGE
ncbi:hypothetical protein AB1Y20_010222 [Prymnesium parvum]|uniref:CASTOR ACT domain-containing protein n=1 Tax=Prymnesium parvum TaxID=97485 RepID=A0AB34K3T0_PRYPA